jgi:hypothetical protein
MYSHCLYHKLFHYSIRSLKLKRDWKEKKINLKLLQTYLAVSERGAPETERVYRLSLDGGISKNLNAPVI